MASNSRKFPIYKYTGQDYFDLVYLEASEIKEHLKGGWYKVVLEDKNMIVFVQSKENIYKLKNMLQAVKNRGKPKIVQFTMFSRN